MQARANDCVDAQQRGEDRILELSIYLFIIVSCTDLVVMTQHLFGNSTTA